MKDKRKMLQQLASAGSLACLILTGAAQAGPSQPESPLPKNTTPYSPYAVADVPNQVFFGDTHLHTAYSADAGLVGAVRTPNDAFSFAKGETVISNNGTPARLKRPLDWLVVTDHAENLGLPIAIYESDPKLLANPWGKEIHDAFRRGTIEGMLTAYAMWSSASLDTMTDPLAQETELAKTMWRRITKTADDHNVPGVFTAFIGFEWTLTPGGNNLHRNVIFRDASDRANAIVPLSAYDTQDPQKLWDWMEAYEKNTGGRILALAHNGNLSNGLMFDDVTLVGNKPLDAAYAARRAKWEPIYEVTQIKGDGEAHPALSPDDEFADYGTWDNGSFGPDPKTPDMLPREYARSALKRGLAYESKIGVNPFKFGLVGSTDSHTALSTAGENNFFGKVAALEPSADPMRFNEAITGRTGTKAQQQTHAMALASGLAAVWARENTREAIFAAFERKEVYATTGSRLRVRVFGGFDFDADDLSRSDFAAHGYANGAPMGGDLSKAPSGKAPSFLVRAARDEDGANLDRLQIIKGWLDQNGQTREQIYDLAVSDGRKIGADGRCRDPVGSTVNVEQASYSNAIGEPFLQAFWRDPDFDRNQRAFYYVRVIEIPTPRWTTYDAKVFGVKIPEGIPASTQERAYTSPIWYSP